MLSIYTPLPSWVCARIFIILFIIIMAQAMPLHASAARLWLLSTLFCPASCMWPPVVYACSSLQSSLIMSIHLFFVFPSFWFHVYIRCMLFFGIVRSSADSDVQNIVAFCSVFCLLFQF